MTKVHGTGSAAMQALRGVDLRIQRGECLAVKGASGSGKSTCLNILGCLVTPTGDQLLLSAIPAKIVRAVALTDGEAAVTQTEAGIEIAVQASNRNAKDTIIELQLDPSASTIATTELPAAR